jgi:polar amino acid transport system ATP-binding protein
MELDVDIALGTPPALLAGGRITAPAFAIGGPLCGPRLRRRGWLAGLSTIAGADLALEACAPGARSFCRFEFPTAIARVCVVTPFPDARLAEPVERRLARAAGRTDAAPVPAIRVASRGKSFGTFRLLDDDDLAVAPGERCAIRGPARSGASPPMRRLDAREDHRSGTIEVDGARPGGPAEAGRARRAPGTVSQHFDPSPHSMARGTCPLAPRRVRGLRAAEADALRRADLGAGPRDGRRDARDHDRARARVGRTMIRMAHRMGVAREVADRVIFGVGGRIVERAAPGPFVDAPRHPRGRGVPGRLPGRSRRAEGRDGPGAGPHR